MRRITGGAGYRKGLSVRPSGARGARAPAPVHDLGLLDGASGAAPEERIQSTRPEGGGPEHAFTEAQARRAAVSFLALTIRSAYEVREYLLRRGSLSSTADSVLDWLQQLGYVDDARFIREWVFKRRRNLVGRDRLRHEILGKGIPGEIVTRELEDAFPFEAEVEDARRLVGRLSRRNWHPDRVLERLWAALARRGFSRKAMELAVAEISCSAGDPRVMPEDPV